MKVSMSKFAQNAAKSSKGAGKVSNPYCKIMLAKGVVTAIRHNDWVSVGIIAGRIGLEVGFEVGRLFGPTAKKVMGKISGPIGGVVDVGLNIWSIVRSALP